MERAKRIFKELDYVHKEILQDKVLDIQAVYETYVNNIQKRREIVSQLKEILDIFDNIARFDDEEIFKINNSQEDENDEEKNINEVKI